MGIIVEKSERGYNAWGHKAAHATTTSVGSDILSTLLSEVYNRDCRRIIVDITFITYSGDNLMFVVIL